MLVSAVMRRAMETLDVALLLTVWREAFPHLPRPLTSSSALVTLHMARTAAECLREKQRVYSHAWLADRGFPSQLPQRLRPAVEQDMSPRIVDAVGVAVKSTHLEVQERISFVMREAVLDAYANGDREPGFVKYRMQSARMRERKALGLRNIHGMDVCSQIRGR